MDTAQHSRYKTPLLVVSVLILVWATMGALDVRNQAYRGFVTDGNNTVTGVAEGGPAEAAGFQVGDYIRSDGGIPVEESRELSARGRAASGLNLMLCGAVVGLGPSIVISIVGMVAPQIVVPGANFLPLAVGLLPVLFALAAVRESRTILVA